MPKIPPRPGVEVFFNKGETVSIKQTAEWPVDDEDAPVVTVHPEDLPKLIGILGDLHNEYLLDEQERRQAELEAAERPSSPLLLRPVGDDEN